MSSTSTKLVTVFKDAENNNVTLNYKYADPEVTAANVKSFMNTVLANGSIFKVVPTAKKSAKVVTTTENDIDISD